MFGIILAGGLGKRMKSKIPKVCYPILGIPMIQRVKKSLENIGIKEIGIIVGCYKNIIEKHIDNTNNVQWLLQEEAKGTGHALQCAVSQLKTNEEYIIVTSGDAPFINQNILENMINIKADAVLLSCTVSDATGYGRIIGANNEFEGIIEHKDCNEEQLKVNRINAGVYCFRLSTLRKYIFKLDNNNTQGEYYLTDIFKMMKKGGEKIIVQVTDDEKTVMNINTKEQLEKAEKIALVENIFV